MSFLKSLICIEGYDNGRRFLAISAVLYLFLLLLLPVLGQAGILVFLLLIIVTPVLLASSIRRIHDASFTLPFAFIPITIYWLNVFGLLYLDHISKWLLFLLALLATVIISTISNIRVRHNHSYQLGYHGPINSNDNIVNKENNRVEPTIATSVFEGIDSGSLENSRVESDFLETNNKTKQQQDSYPLKEHIVHWFNSNKKIAFGSIAVSILALVIIIFSSDTSIRVSDETNGVSQQNNNENFSPEFKKERHHKLEMPDNFWLMLDQNNALTIGWEGDLKRDGSYWSTITGKGDKTCTNLHFSLGEDIRTIEVTVKASEDYYADFSPVDTQLIIKSIADKDRFKLCGYEFVLKGTRSLLRKHEHYRGYINNL